MRYYTVSIPGAPAAFPVRYDDGAIWGTEQSGRHDPGAQQVEFHIEELRPNLPSSDSTITIHGVSWEQIRETGGLIGKPIIVKGGMRPGLPLATVQSRKAGLLMEAQIIRAWGNWIGTEMSIGLTFVPAGATNAEDGGGSSDGGSSAASQAVGAVQSAVSGGAGAQSFRFGRVGARSIDRRPFARGAVARLGMDTPVVSPTGIGDIGQLGGGVFGAATTFSGGIASSFFGGGIRGLQAPLNLIHNLMPNMSMSSAISETLGKAFPRGGSDVQISQGLKLPYQDAGMYQNLQQYAQYINNISSSILGVKKYMGVQFSAHTNTIKVWDMSSVGQRGVIEVIDLIGQPTWIDQNMINIKTILRGDIHCGMTVTLPPTIMALSQGAIIPGAPGSIQKTNVSFTGNFRVWRVLHLGDFRNPDGAGWSSNFECLFEGAGSGQAAASQTVEDSSKQQNPNDSPPKTDSSSD